MKIKLTQLMLKNFKGVLEAVYNFQGLTNVYGANESGKSTIYTAFCWLLTGKDEFDRKDYEIKNTKKPEYNSQAHEVEGVFTVDNKEVRLKRVYLEKWVKPKGKSTKEFEGHKTEFYFNDVPCSATEYQTKVDGIIPANYIKLVTNPNFFNSLPWERQRAALLQIAGEITNEDVINSIRTPKSNFSTLIEALNGDKSLEEWRKQLVAKKNLLKKAGEELPTRIDEAKRNMPEAHDWETLALEKAGLESEIVEIDLLLSNAATVLKQKQTVLMNKQRDLHTKQTELSTIRHKISSELIAKHATALNDVRAAEADIKNHQNRISLLKQADVDNQQNVATYKMAIETKEATIVALRADWDAINGEKFEFNEEECVCTRCKQQLPAGDIDETRETLRKNFNESVIKRKSDKVDQSNQVKVEITQLNDRIAKIEETNNGEEIAEIESKIKTLENKLNELNQVLKSKKVDDIDAAVEALLNKNAKALNVKDEILEIEHAIKKEQSAIDLDSDSETAKNKDKKLRFIQQLDEVKANLAVKATIDKTEIRIKELVREAEANAQEVAYLEQQEFEIEAFVRGKMDILQDRVNTMFKYVTFRMFDKQVNGGIAETCVCEYKGVPYPTLNTAARLLAGLDVLNVLSNYYQVFAPVFCDNRESVTFIPESQSQIISLFVSPADKKIRLEQAA